MSPSVKRQAADGRRPSGKVRQKRGGPPRADVADTGNLHVIPAERPALRRRKVVLCTVDLLDEYLGFAGTER